MTYKSKATKYASRYGKLYRSGYRTTVEPHVAMRKVRALAAIGHTHTRIAKATGLGDRQYVSHLANGDRTRISLATAKAIDAYYAAHHLNPLDTTDARRAKSFARKRNWMPPFAYDDITDLTCEPRGLRK